ncbi:hypothetical protein ES708_01389 [subsurface metagenome]
MKRFERQKEILELLEGNQLTVRELKDIIEINEVTITLNLVDFLLRHYNKMGYLKRRKNLFNLYSYELSKNGEKQLEWLRNGDYLDYIEVYELMND